MAEYTENTGANASSLLGMAQKVHDEFVSEGERKSKEKIEAATRQADELLTAAQNEADTIVSDAEQYVRELRETADRDTAEKTSAAEKEATRIVEQAKQDAADLESRVNTLKLIELEYRVSLEHSAKKTLEELSTHADTAHTAHEGTRTI